MKQYVPIIGEGIFQNIKHSNKLKNITEVYKQIIRENPLIAIINKAIINFVTNNPQYNTPEHITNITTILLYKSIESQLEVEEMEREIKL